MTDKELLEVAARAAGIEIDHWRGDMPMVNESEYDANEYHAWNPLTDDGDALRLAVKLRLRVLTPTSDTDVAIASCGDVRGTAHVHQYSEDEYTDPYAATRRAIVRAAAAVGSRHNAESSTPQGVTRTPG